MLKCTCFSQDFNTCILTLIILTSQHAAISICLTTFFFFAFALVFFFFSLHTHSGHERMFTKSLCLCECLSLSHLTDEKKALQMTVLLINTSVFSIQRCVRKKYIALSQFITKPFWHCLCAIAVCRDDNDFRKVSFLFEECCDCGPYVETSIAFLDGLN